MTTAHFSDAMISINQTSANKLLEKDHFGNGYLDFTTRLKWIFAISF